MSNTDKALDAMANALRPAVAAIEASPAITQNHYDRYMTVISYTFSQYLADVGVHIPTRQAQLLIGTVLIQAGANRAGVQAALRALGAI